MVLRAQNAKLRDQIATLVFQQCLSENPFRQIPSDAQQPLSPSLSASHFLRADSGPGSAPGTSSSSLARNPSANLAQSTLFRAPSGASQMMSQLGQQGVSQTRASQAVSTQQLSQQMAEERRKYGQAVGAKDDRIRELDEQLKTLKQTQQAESSSYKNRWALLAFMSTHAFPYAASSYLMKCPGRVMTWPINNLMGRLLVCLLTVLLGCSSVARLMYI